MARKPRITSYNVCYTKLLRTLLEASLIKMLAPLKNSMEGEIPEVTAEFFRRLPAIYDKLTLDAEAIVKGDPAARDLDEVILTYPGFLAISIYRIAHEFFV